MLRPYRKGTRWHRPGTPDGYHCERSELGWSSRLCTDEDSNHVDGSGCEASVLRRFERRDEQTEVRGNGRDPE
jgi:hypothetical protein